MPIQLQTEGRLARITLARPPLNILDVADLTELAGCVDHAADAAVVVVGGGDARCFSAGNDIKDHTPDRAPAMLAAFHRAIRGLLVMDAITVADVRGDALGGGCELVAACDLAYAAPEARFGQPEIDVGCFPPVAVSLLPRRIGWTRATEMVTLGKPIDAEAAAAWGLITRVAEAGPVVDALLAKSPDVLRLTKKALRAGRLEEAERIYLDELLGLEDCQEGIEAFLAKRSPRWRSGV